MKLAPYQQGGLDSMCGLYGIVNASRMINRSTEEESQALFNKIILYLEKRKLLVKVLIEGATTPQMMMVLKRTTNLAANVPWRGVSTPPLDEFWSSMQEWLEYSERSVILGLNGYHDHWTVVSKITDKGIALFDSGGIARIQREKCSTTPQTRKHLLLPAQTYFLEVR